MHDLLTQALVFLLATVVAVPLFNRLKLGAVVAYLVAGALLGPSGFKVIVDGEAGMAAGELGVVLLLFIIGLELSPARLWLMRRAVFAVGTLQVVVTTALLAVAIWALGQSWLSATIAGLALALSSTAIGVQLMSERKELALAHGRTALAVLLFQDMAAIPAIGILPLLGTAAVVAVAPADTSTGVAILLVLGVITGLVVAGHYLVRPLLRYVAATRSLEVFTAATLLIALGTAWITELAIHSMTLGAFLAGILLAESEFRHEIEAHIEPFKGLLLGLFFLGVGLTVDWSYVGAHALGVTAGVFGLLAVKSAVLYAIGRRVARLDHGDSLRLAALLSQGGEFAFVLFALASGSALVAPDVRDLLTAIVVVSMAATPLLVLGLDRYLGRTAPKTEPVYDTIPDEEHARVIIAGFGRVGQIVARVLRSQRIAFTALEHSAEQVEVSRRFGNKIYYGDPSRPDLLRASHVERAEIFVVATDDPEANLRTARLVKRTYPHLKVFARARNRQHAFRLMELDLDGIVRETLHSSLVLAGQVLEALGTPTAQVKDRLERFLKHDQKVLRAQQLIRDDEAKLIQSSQESLVELEQLFEADLKTSD